MRSRAARLVVLTFGVLLPFATGAVAAEATPTDDPFPVPDGLRDAVAFWKQVWSGWSMSQVVVHDNAHLGVVYAVVDLPGPVKDTYTDEQRRFNDALQSYFADRIRALEAKIATREPLDDLDKTLALQIVTAAGAEAITNAHERVRVQRGLRERFRRGVELSGRYLAEFKKIFPDAGLPEDLAYLPHVESSFRSEARSSAGAVGMWQFTRSAARVFMTVNGAIDERNDPVAAARGAARYLKKAWEELGSWPLALTSYNHGIAGMARAKERFGDDFEVIVREFDGRAFGFASRNFYASFVAARDAAKELEPPPPDLSPEPPLAVDRFVLTRPTRVVALAHSFGVDVGTLAGLNPAWTRRAVRGNAPLPKGTNVWLPEGTLERMARSRAADRRTSTLAPAAAAPPAPGAKPEAN